METAKLAQVQRLLGDRVGRGESVGPLRVTSLRSRIWLSHLIESPDRMLAERDTIATTLYTKYTQVQMSNLALGDPDIAALIAYLDAQSAALKETKDIK